MTVPGLKLEEHLVGGVHVIATDGEIDHMSAPLLADALRRATLEGDGNVVLDLCETSFIDSAGISTLLNGLRRLTRQRRRMLIVCPPGGVYRVFELLGLVGTFNLVGSREQALAVA
jgi:anti-sigma B factor antagonist